MTYETKYIRMEHEITEEADLIDYPIIEFFADHIEMGHNVARVYNEYNPLTHTYFVSGSNVMTADEANKAYKGLIADGYKVVECKVD